MKGINTTIAPGYLVKDMVGQNCMYAYQVSTNTIYHIKKYTGEIINRIDCSTSPMDEQQFENYCRVEFFEMIEIERTGGEVPTEFENMTLIPIKTYRK